MGVSAIPSVKLSLQVRKMSRSKGVRKQSFTAQGEES